MRIYLVMLHYLANVYGIKVKSFIDSTLKLNQYFTLFTKYYIREVVKR